MNKKLVFQTLDETKYLRIDPSADVTMIDGRAYYRDMDYKPIGINEPETPNKN